MYVPIRHGGRSVGMVSLQSYTSNAFTSADLGTFENLAAYCSGALERIEVETALARERTLLRTLVDHLPLCIFVKDRDGRKLLANSGDVRNMGLSSEAEALGCTDLDVYPPEQAHRQMAMDRQVIDEGGTILDVEEEFINPNGERVRLRTSKLPLRDESGSITGLVGYSVDITHRKEMEDRLRESEARFRRAIEELPIPVMLHDEEGQVLMLSRGWTHYSGYSREDLPTLSDWTERAYGERVGPKKLYIDRLFEADDTMDNGEWTIRARDGSTRIWAFQTSPLGRLHVGRRVILSLALDVTEQKGAERRLRESEEKFIKAFQASAHTITITRLRDGAFLEVNEAFTRACGYSREEALGNSSLALDLWADPAEREGVMAQIAHEGTVVDQEHRFRTKDGRILTGLYSAHTIQIGGEECLLTSLNDITERKRGEESLRHLLEERTALLREVHHRVKNNLQIVSSLLNLQAARTRHADDLEALEITRSRVRSMALLHETLYHSTSLARVDFTAYIGRVCNQILRSSAPRLLQRVHLHQDLQPLELSLDQAVPCGLLIHELVSNALKHAFPADREGTINLSLRTARPTDTGIPVEFEVTDNGVGLAEDFDPEDTSTLGLQLVSSLVRQLQGNLDIRREPDTSFRVTFQA
ncbi:MAG: PAS domain S-box protein, partial [Verrucomicrobiae bacterium]|nr:PAS domain S-box protein [Verrucomicrobiae bacterium]